MILIKNKLIRIPQSLEKLHIKIYDCKAHIEDNTMKVSTHWYKYSKALSLIAISLKQYSSPAVSEEYPE